MNTCGGISQIRAAARDVITMTGRGSVRAVAGDVRHSAALSGRFSGGRFPRAEALGCSVFALRAMQKSQTTLLPPDQGLATNAPFQSPEGRTENSPGLQAWDCSLDILLARRAKRKQPRPSGLGKPGPKRIALTAEIFRRELI
jgi:hypothetical protein